MKTNFCVYQWIGIGLGMLGFLLIGGCNIGKSSESTTKVTPGDIFGGNVNINPPKGYPARTVQRCRYINHKTGRVTVRIGLPMDKVGAPQRTAAEEKEFWDKFKDLKIPSDKKDFIGPVPSVQDDDKYQLVQYVRDLCGISKRLDISGKNSGLASTQTNFVPNFQIGTNDDEVHCDFLSQGEFSPKEIKPGQILSIPMDYKSTSSGIKLNVNSIFMKFKVTSVHQAGSVFENIKAQAEQLCRGTKPRDILRFRGHFLPLQYYNLEGKEVSYGADILYLWGPDLGKGMSVFQPLITADSHDTGADQERPRLLVGFLKDIIKPLKLKKSGDYLMDPAKDYRSAWVYDADEKTEYDLIVGNSCY